MAKTSSVIKNNRRIEMVTRFRERREALREASKNINISYEDRREAQRQLEKLPRDSSPIRIRTRCLITGRARAVYRDFKLSRIKFREMALNGELPGVTKASW